MLFIVQCAAYWERRPGQWDEGINPNMDLKNTSNETILQYPLCAAPKYYFLFFEYGCQLFFNRQLCVTHTAFKYVFILCVFYICLFNFIVCYVILFSLLNF